MYVLRSCPPGRAASGWGALRDGGANKACLDRAVGVRLPTLSCLQRGDLERLHCSGTGRSISYLVLAVSATFRSPTSGGARVGTQTRTRPARSDVGGRSNACCSGERGLQCVDGRAPAYRCRNADRLERRAAKRPRRYCQGGLSIAIARNLASGDEQERRVGEDFLLIGVPVAGLRKQTTGHTILCGFIIELCVNLSCWAKPMTYDEFLAELGKAGLSVRAFADLIGMNPNSVSNYASTAEVPRHLAFIAVLLAEMKLHGLNFQPAIERVSANRKKPRGRGRPGRFGGDKQEQLELEA